MKGTCQGRRAGGLPSQIEFCTLVPHIETAPPLVTNQLHSKEHRLVENELIAHASHAHALFKEDNSTMYYHLEEAMHGTTYAASLKPIQRHKDG